MQYLFSLFLCNITINFGTENCMLCFEKLVPRAIRVRKDVLCYSETDLKT